MKDGVFAAEGDKTYLLPPFLSLALSLSGSFLAFVRLQREKHLSLVWVELCHRRNVPLLVCVCVYLFGCLDERGRAAASIAHLSTSLRAFECSPAVWWPIQPSVASHILFYPPV